MENSIEEDIKIVENYLANSAINETNSNFFKNGGWETVDLEIPKSMKHILSDYKRLLKENEQLRTEVNSLKKENETLKNDYENLSNSVVVKNHCIKNSIPVSLVKDKIEEIQEEGYWLFTTDRDSDKCVEVLQQLLESEE